MRRLTPQAVLLILRKRAQDAEVASLSPHDFRRTFCSDLLDAGVDIVTVASLAGHSSPQVVTQYDSRGEEVKRKVVQQLSIPRKKKKRNSKLSCIMLQFQSPRWAEVVLHLS